MHDDRLLGLIDSLGVVVWEAEPGTARLTFVSREIEAYLGRPAETCLDAPGGWTDLAHLDDRTALTALRARQIADRTDLEVEYRLVAPDGRSVWVREISRYCPAAGGEPETLRGVLMNVNKRKKMERKLHYAREDVETEVRDLRLLQELSERLSLSIALPDVLAEIVSAASSVLGTDMGSVALYDADRDEIRIAAAAGVSDEFLGAIGGKRPGETPCSRALTEGRSVSFRDIAAEPEYAGVCAFYLARGVRALFATPLLGHTGQPIGVLSAYFAEPHCPAERQQAFVELYARQAGQILANARRHAALLDAGRDTAASLAAVGRELRAPLAAMGKALRHLDDACGEAGRAPRSALARQVRSMARIVADCLTASVAPRARQEARTDPADPAAAVAAAVEAARPLFESLSHRLTVDVPAADPIRIEADPTRLAQVVVNLLNNAARFTPAGGEVALTLRREGDEAVLRVSDSGIGIAPELVPHVFDRPGRGGGGASPPHRGIGIGLARVKTTVELYGGTVSASSPGVGLGCAVTVRLPIAPRPAPGPPSVAGACPVPGAKS